MILQNGCRWKVEKSKGEVTTSFAGLPLLTELAHHIGLVAALDSLPDLWERAGTYRTSDYLLGLALTLMAGGDGLDDTRVLAGDGGLAQLALAGMPAPNSIGGFLRRFRRRSLARLGEIVTAQAVESVKPGQTITVDIDSTVIESDKKEAKRTYKGVDGYNPLLAWVDELDMFLGGVFREGNASPQSHITSLLRYCRRRLPPGVGIRLRSDSAAYRLDVMRDCERHGNEFAIRADVDSAVRGTIEKIRRQAWQLVVRGNDSFLLAETIHAPGQSGSRAKADVPAYRLIVIRRTGQLDLFRDPIEYYPIITNLPESWNALQVVDFYNGRGRMEKAIGEAKNGFGLHWLPCGDLLANAAYFQTVLLAYNLVRRFKRAALPEGWQSFSIKSLRFRLLCHAGVIVRHARRVILRLSDGFPFYDVFEQARWAVMNPTLAPA
jgi:hypothetical protein